jgi:hypothetical protein
MANFLMDLLRASGSPRMLNEATLEKVVEVFKNKVSSTLESEARHHPLGFIYVSERLDDRMTLRYHLWPPSWAAPAGQQNGTLHDHQFELNSIVVAGSLQQTSFTCRYDVNGNYSVFDVKYSPVGSVLEASGDRANLEIKASDTFRAGSAYRLPPGVPHEVEPATRPAATIVLAILGAVPTPARVFVLRGQVPTGEFERAPLNLEEVEAAKSTLQALSR